MKLVKKKVRVYQYTSGYGIIHLSLTDPSLHSSREYMIISEQTMNLEMPDMTDQELRAFYDAEMNLRERATLEAQKAEIEKRIGELNDLS